MSNDSDSLEPLKIVRCELNLPLGTLNPQKRPSRVLLKHASFIKKIRRGVLAASQIPTSLEDHRGKFHKLKSW